MERKKISAYDRVLTARKSDRPSITDYIVNLFDEFVELKGDRLRGNDPAIIGGIAMFHGIPVTVIGHKKGKTTEENIRCNFGMASPEGYRKAVRLMKQAEKFNRPVITFIDTPGAYPGMEAEAGGQSTAIAESIATMTTLKCPVISIITGEGGSGGALALAGADSVWMLENAVYSILSPEGFATIMYRDASLASKAADVMKLTAGELKAYHLIDGVIPEGKRCYKALDRVLMTEIKRLSSHSPAMLARLRYKKIQTYGKIKTKGI